MHSLKIFFQSLPVFAAVLGAPAFSKAADLVPFEAESGVLGADWSVVAGSPAYITILTDGAGNNPGSATRVASFTINFPGAGIYQLYARLRTGPGTFNDDSMFYAASFGSKTPTLNSDWILVNGLAGVGFSNSTDVVTGGGTLGSGMWKWVNLSQFTSQSGFTVTASNLTQTFQIGARENGLDLDKFAFGTDGTAFTVADLDNGTAPVPPGPATNTFIGPDGMALHRFSPLNNGQNAEGANPAAGLILSGGVLWGTALNGGSQGAGAAFAMSLDGTNFNAFRTFANTPDAGNPQGELLVSGNTFFGTSLGGGANGVGAVVAGQTNGSVSLLRSFTVVSADNATNSDGASPSSMIVLAGNTLYGATAGGGTAANGTIFSQTTNGATFSVLHNFTLLDSQTGTNTDGAVPWGGLILSGSTLYGTASAGGAGGNGVVFSVNTSGDNFMTLHSFAPMDTLAGTNADGAMPIGGLVLSNNTLYGTTSYGGPGGRGTIFSMGANGTEFTVLHPFTPTDSVTRTNTDGASPVAALTLAGGVLYGTAPAGGSGAGGTVFSVSTNGASYQTVYSFAALHPSSGTNRFGACPVAPLLLVGNSLYGTTFSGGPGAAGTVFSLHIAAPPAVINNVINNLNGTVTLYFLGGPNSTNVIQSAASLMPPVAWQNVSTNVADAGGAWQFTDSNNNTTRFYRSYAP